MSGSRDPATAPEVAIIWRVAASAEPTASHRAIHLLSPNRDRSEQGAVPSGRAGWTRA